MSQLLFLDESGHDHKTMPYEVRGGIAIDAAVLWAFVQAIRALETSCFGDHLHNYKTEIKGFKLLDKDRFKWAAQAPTMDERVRRKHCLAFLNKGLEKKPPTRNEFTAYGQACLAMVRGIFSQLAGFKIPIFAAVIPRGAVKPQSFEADEYLRKDQVFMLERYFYFLEHKNSHGLIVMDETDKVEDRRFVKRLERYFMASATGQHRTLRIVPSPFFVSSDMAYPVQVADVCIYAINHGFRLPNMSEPVRADIQAEFSQIIRSLQFRGDGIQFRTGNVVHCKGIVYVPNPYGSGNSAGA
jgi:hypothetical protein